MCTCVHVPPVCAGTDKSRVLDVWSWSYRQIWAHVENWTWVLWKRGKNSQSLSHLWKYIKFMWKFAQKIMKVKRDPLLSVCPTAAGSSVVGTCSHGCPLRHPPSRHTDWNPLEVCPVFSNVEAHLFAQQKSAEGSLCAICSVQDTVMEKANKCPRFQSDTHSRWVWASQVSWWDFCPPRHWHLGIAGLSSRLSDRHFG